MDDAGLRGEWVTLDSKKLLFFFVFFLMSIVVISGIGERGLYLKEYSIDEKLWQDRATDYLHSVDNKSPAFLMVYHYLGIGKTVLYTRILNYLIMIACTLLIYSMTKRWESFLFMIIPLYLDNFVLLDTSFEVFFILLAIKYEKHSGIFTGLAMIFRPTAIIYTLLINRRQQTIVLAMGLLFSVILLATGSFFNYLNMVTTYALGGRYLISYAGPLFLGVFAYLGWQNEDKRIFYYGCIACIPLLLRVWGHYFIPAYTFFFLSYLLSESDTTPL